ncbi:hypothetical protein D7W79_09795 [Corallococcus exercitus]|uniref:phage tail protein n=1 Tax=Corallococcus exercitus TaxID=2316736 RepID=UPI000EA00F97|nr:phage tail protein [Corallococcus exercitus]RKG79684.1 hypothetical protein D7W79_09795 [Corallococcus exercitus]
MSDELSGYLRFLPVLLTRRGPGNTPSFIEKYLQIPESILGQRDGTLANVQRGMAAVLDILPSLLYPRLSFLFPGSTAVMPPVEATNAVGDPNDAATARTLRTLNALLGIVPIDTTLAKDKDPWRDAVLDWLTGYLDWLGSWLAFTANPEWSVDRRRSVLAGLMPLYRKRGTRDGLEGLLRLFIAPDIRVIDLVHAPPLLLGENSTLADTYSKGDGVLDGTRPLSFAVDLPLPTYDLDSVATRALITSVRTLVDAEKPLQTRYEVRPRTVTFTIGQYSHVGVDTLIPLRRTRGSRTAQ